MQLFENVKTRTRLFIGFGFIIASIILIVSGSYLSLVKIRDAQNEVTLLSNTSNNLLHLLADQNRVRAVITDMMLFNNQQHQDSTIAEIGKIEAISKARVIEIKQELNNYPDFLSLFGEIEVLLDKSKLLTDKQVIQMKEGKNEEAHINLLKDSDLVYEKLLWGMRQVDNGIEKTLKEHAEKNSSIIRIEMTKLLVISSFLLLVATLLMIMVLRMLRRIFAEIQTGVNVLGTAANEILTTVTEVSTGAAETATSISETTVTIEEIRQTAAIATQKAQEVLESAHNAAESAIGGKESVQQAIEGMGRISQQMQWISQSVDSLAQKNRSIAEITSTVSDIADQSNLLAVNAAIEAAKAGEYGRGFTVVAQEIRNLAEQSKKATSQVKEILNEIQRGMTLAVTATEKGSRTVEEGSNLAAQSGKMIEVLAATVNEAAQSVMQISASNQQQMAGMDQIVPAMENIRAASDQNVQGTRQTQIAAQDLNDLGHKLQSIIEKFKI